MSPPHKGALKQSALKNQRTAALLAIGDELTSGDVLNTNSAFLAAQLTESGFDVREHAVVTDDPDAIRAALVQLQDRVGVAVVTGGLGPTEDDRTVDVVCGLLDVKATAHAPSLAALKERFTAHGFTLTPNTLRQVRVPEGAQVLPNAVGLAPGFYVSLGQTRVFFLPGVPHEMTRIFADHVVGQLGTWLPRAGATLPVTRTWHVYGMGESHVDHLLAHVLDGLPDATLHFRAASPETHVKVVIRGLGAPEAEAALARVDAEVRKRLGAGIFGVDGETFALGVSRSLRAAGATLALAESCTGGLVGAMITAVPGASDFFLGSVIAYSNAMKVGLLGVQEATLAKHGAVSEPCAKQMAEGARRVSGASLAVAVTGIAGTNLDGEATQKTTSALNQKPVGTVCFALASAKATKAVTKSFTGGREAIVRAAAYFALDMARRHRA
jgi:nicotinamide-nucleotide amidase